MSAPKKRVKRIEVYIMSKMTDIQVELKNAENDTIYGSLTIEGVARLSPDADNISEGPAVKDPQGAGAFLAIVILVYAVAVVFLIASHVFVKKKEDTLDYQMQMVEKYWQESFSIKENGARESFKKLKHSMVPAVAMSTARDLISHRKSFAPILANAGIDLENSNQKTDFDKSNGMSVIEEGNEEEVEGEEDEEDYIVLPSTTVNYNNEATDSRKNQMKPNSAENFAAMEISTIKTFNGGKTAKPKPSGQRVSFSKIPEYVQDVNIPSEKTQTCSSTNSLRVPEVHVTVSPFFHSDEVDNIEEEYLSTAAVNRAFQKSPVNVRVSPSERIDYFQDALHPLAAESECLLSSFEDTRDSEANYTGIGQSPIYNTHSPYSSKISLDCFRNGDENMKLEGLHHVTI